MQPAPNIFQKIIANYRDRDYFAQILHIAIPIAALALWIRAANMMVIIGALRGGGDTIFSLFLDGFVIWLVGVPLAATAAFLLHLPLQWVYVFVLSEELTKFVIGLWRFFSKKWINNMTSVVTAA